MYLSVSLRAETDGIKYLFLKLFHWHFKITLMRSCSPSGKTTSSVHHGLKSCHSLYFISLLWCLTVASDEISIIFPGRPMSFMFVLLFSSLLLPLRSWRSIICTSCKSLLIYFPDFVLPAPNWLVSLRHSRKCIKYTVAPLSYIWPLLGTCQGLLWSWFC